MAKTPRAVEQIYAEVNEVAGKIGFLQFQLEREIPREIEKYHNQMHDLQNEAKKAIEAHSAFEEMMAKNGATAVKTEMNGGTHPEPPEDKNEKPELAVVQ